MVKHQAALGHERLDLGQVQEGAPDDVAVVVRVVEGDASKQMSQPLFTRRAREHLSFQNRMFPSEPSRDLARGKVSYARVDVGGFDGPVVVDGQRRGLVLQPGAHQDCAGKTPEGHGAC